jgi:nitrite reductase (NADH) large subunit
MDRQLDAEAAEMLAGALDRRGVELRLGTTVAGLSGRGRVQAVRLTDGSELAVSLVVSAIGIAPETRLARAAGLACDRGIQVDDTLTTSDDHIHAVGECVQHRGYTFGLVAPVHEQAKVLACRLAGDLQTRYGGTTTSARLKVSGVELFSAGQIEPTAGDQSVVYRDPAHGDYRRLLLRDDRLIGVVLYGDTDAASRYFELMSSGAPLGPSREQLAFGNPDGSHAIAHVASERVSERSNEMTDKQRLVVIGSGMVGHCLVQSLLDAEGTDRFAITVLSEEPRLAYDRVHLSEYFSGRSAEELALADGEAYSDAGIRVRVSCAAQSIDRTCREVITAQGERFGYDRLVIATGSYPFVPPIPGNDREGCFVYRTLEDLDAMRAAATGGGVGVVIGGGLLGLEAANALKCLGLDTHVVEFAPRLMPVQLDEGGGAELRRKIEALGVTIHTGKATQVIEDGEQRRHRLRFADGSEIETDLVVFSAGIRPRDQLAREADLEVGERGGIVVDDHCRSSDEAIYAVGECALWGGRIYGLVAPGYAMARAAAAHLLNGDARFSGADMSTKLKLLGVEVGSIGDAQASTAGAQCYLYQDGRNGVYKKLVASSDGKHLIGAVLVGDTSDYDTLLQYALNGIDLPPQPESLILPTPGDVPARGLSPDQLPACAQICSCHNVSKGAIVQCLEAGCSDLGTVRSETKASTGCGGCAALLKDLVASELTRRGIAVNNDICEHFSHTRQELYHLVRVEGIRSFQELRQRHGRGRGCDICKPAVASILASCWNEYVLKDELVGLQDTNDVFLANMQRDGTYSVVPRVAGGEITPDKLIALGRVAKRHGLYTKITGGQRVDLFGARLEELPKIWSELIDAGFETGHAYGKAVRTVKSCVGSTWCRFGVQDSVAMAIFLENRYKGLRAPHKLKFGVSGCTRECAEAQSKDVGVIATERGWNLYVCGNGGMKPRHADLFATDLDDQSLVRLIDRFLMFYVRSADRLQRTAVWMQKLEGGLDYLKEVIIDDRLQIATELEQQMSQVIGSYQCEWTTTVRDPQRLKRFRAFVNSKRQDEHVLFVEERGQPRPATADERATACQPLAEAG